MIIHPSPQSPQVSFQGLDLLLLLIQDLAHASQLCVGVPGRIRGRGPRWSRFVVDVLSVHHHALL
jgi:hypothetical protein